LRNIRTVKHDNFSVNNGPSCPKEGELTRGDEAEPSLRFWPVKTRRGRSGSQRRRGPSQPRSPPLRPSAGTHAQPYRRRRPEATTLHRIVRGHLGAYLALARESEVAPRCFEQAALAAAPFFSSNNDTSRYRRLAQVSGTIKATAVMRRRAGARNPRVHLAMNYSKEPPLFFPPPSPSRFFCGLGLFTQFSRHYQPIHDHASRGARDFDQSWGA
jgi:hypothetical protein